MAVTNPETFVLSGPGVGVNATQVVDALARHGITATSSNAGTAAGTVTITNSSISGKATGAKLFETIHRICDAQGGILTYTNAT